MLWFVRHGESEGNVRGDSAPLPWRDADIPLTPRGVAQARVLGRWFAEQPRRPTAVVSSPYVRARDTADELVRGGGLALAALPVGEDDHWRDRDPVAESWADVTGRVGAALADLRRAAGQRLLVVAHDAVIQVARGVLTGLDEAAALALVTTPYPNAGLATFERRPAGYVCTAYGWTVPPATRPR